MALNLRRSAAAVSVHEHFFNCAAACGAVHGTNGDLAPCHIIYAFTMKDNNYK
jgi:hypothetical protein